MSRTFVFFILVGISVVWTASDSSFSAPRLVPVKVRSVSTISKGASSAPRTVTARPKPAASTQRETLRTTYRREYGLGRVVPEATQVDSIASSPTSRLNRPAPLNGSPRAKSTNSAYKAPEQRGPAGYVPTERVSIPSWIAGQPQGAAAPVPSASGSRGSGSAFRGGDSVAPSANGYTVTRKTQQFGASKSTDNNVAAAKRSSGPSAFKARPAPSGGAPSIPVRGTRASGGANRRSQQAFDRDGQKYLQNYESQLKGNNATLTPKQQAELVREIKAVRQSYGLPAEY